MKVQRPQAFAVPGVTAVRHKPSGVVYYLPVKEAAPDRRWILKHAGLLDLAAPVAKGLVGGALGGTKALGAGVKSLAAPAIKKTPLPKPWADMNPGRITTGPPTPPRVSGLNPGRVTVGPPTTPVNTLSGLNPGRVTSTPLPPPLPLAARTTGSGTEVMRGAGQLAGSAASAAGGLVKQVPKVVKNLVNDAQGGFSAADTARAAARVNPATSGFLGRQVGSVQNALPYLNPMNAPRGLGVLAERGLGRVGDAVGGMTGAAVGGAGKALGGLGKLTSYAGNLAQSAPSSLITGSGRMSGLARGAVTAGSAASTAGAAAYGADKWGRKNLGVGLLGRGGRDVARAAATAPMNPLALADVHMPSALSLPGALLSGGQDFGASKSEIASRDMPEDLGESASLPTLFEHLGG